MGTMRHKAGRVWSFFDDSLRPNQSIREMETTLCHQNRLSSLSVRLVIIASALLFLGSNATERDVFRSDVLTFHGNQKVSADSLTSDSFLVTLPCRTADPVQNLPLDYSIILRKIDPVEKALLQDAQYGKWERFDLFRASMIVEGIRDPELIRTYEARLNALVAKVLSAAQAEGNNSPQTLTRSLFEAMHREILTKPYSLDCTELSKVMQTGHFNCVSATILFNCLAEKAGLDVCALEMPGHALSRVKFFNGVAMNLETTCPTWFDLQSDKERQMATLQRVAVAPAVAMPNPATAQNAAAPPEVVAEAELPSNLREISPVQLVATVYYNIGVDLLTKKCYPEAAAANIKALYLDKNNEQAWLNLLASLNNWALELAQGNNGKGRRYDIATVILDQGVSLDPTYANFRSNQTFVFFYWIRGLAESGDFDKARQVYAHAHQRLPGNQTLQNLMNEVNQGEETLKQLRK